MSRPDFLALWVLLTAAAPIATAAPTASPAQERTATAVARPHPADAAASVPKALHRSALAGYRRHAEPEAKPWRQANDDVARIGGWRAYAREAAEAPPAAPTAPAAASGVRR